MAVARTEPLPSGRWRGVATIEGRRVTRSFDTEGQALHWADVQMRAAEVAARRPKEPVSGEPAGFTFGQFVEIYLATRTVEPDTVATYRSSLGPAVARWGEWALTAVTYADVVAWVAEMSRGRGRSRPAPRTVPGRLKQVRAVYAEARRMGHASLDPTAGVRLPKIPESPFRVIEPAEEQALFTATREHGVYVPTLVALEAGLRWAEVFGLHRHRVNPLRQRLTVADVLARPDFQPREYPKGKRYRTVWMTDRLAAALTEHIEARQVGPNGLLFTSRTGTPVDYHNFRHVWDRVIKQAGLAAPKPTFHDLRHSFGTRMAAAGTPSKEIALLMGHANTTTTDLYIHSAGPQVAEAWMRHALQGDVSPIESLGRREQAQ